MKQGDTLYIVVPCYNEQEVLPETSSRLSKQLTSMIETGDVSPNSRIVFVDDGSKDDTWSIIRDLHSQNALFSGVKLSRNRGHQNALLAGLMQVKDHCDAAISIDADLQDDVDVIPLFFQKYLAGNDIVYGVRSDRKTDSAFKRMTAEGFYRFMKALGANVVFNHADCRLMSRRALQALSEFREVNLFLRGMVPMIGFPTATAEYERAARFAGESKYSLKKMLALAFEGITSFSIKPIRLITSLGLLILSVSLAALLILAALALFTALSISIPHYLLASLWIATGLLLVSLGVVGEYVGKSHEELKARPRYFIETFLHH